MKRNILYILLLFLLAGCHEEVEQQARLNISLYLPAGEMSYKTNGPRRLMGDPGTSEQFALPKYAYIFVLRKGAGDTWSMWRREERILSQEKWERGHYYGESANIGDSIFRYTEKLQLILREDNPKGHIYAICSNQRLTFDTPLSSVTNLTDVLNLKFSTAPDSIQENLQNIYSTPYNYTKADDSYYCSYDCSARNSYTIDLLLYHVAAKVDIKWNVEEDKRINKADRENAVRLTYMEARNLFNGNAYCFKPMRNTVASMPTEGQNIKIIADSTNEGQWWEGRSYFYTIPYTVTGDPNYFPLQMTLKTNGNDGEGYKPTLKMQIDPTAVFVPWLRANFNLSKPLEDETETKIVDN